MSLKHIAIVGAVTTSLLLAACGGDNGSAVDAATGKSSTLAATAKSANTSSSIFYGMNGHNNSGGAYDISSPQTQLSQLHDLGATIYRNEVYNQASANKLAGIAQIMAAGGVTVYPVMLLGLGYSNEQDAYNAGYTLGKQTASAYHYKYYEVGNELEAATLNGNVDGVVWQHYDSRKYQIARGIIRGLIAGVKSEDTEGKIVLGGTWLHYAFYQMLADGSQPDGTWGHPAVSWDITAWHWYSNEGDITNACGGTGCHDVLAVLHEMGKPIWINEFGVRPSLGSLFQIASYLTGNDMMSQYVSVASKYNIQSIQAYELYDDAEGAYGMMQGDGHTQKPAYASFRTFVQNHPR
ncbi:lipopolysaccharide biosynthesis protein [Caballeronia sp. LZ062]|uniref:lipopolysaccharide biosynthesis protein n=1 Tax=unclassified Caballeronia TaxID=2646786 RepID=UPI0028606AE8|nr:MULTISPECIES: lipopolysaccharide biosynthesis protein [unclassified Caballeronia]MDR5856894.1 lipopolysaccharide biosynthesis protein [Caballeronia sp. LZ050]MDR5869709.1 lipopolysaccharide biosynthesis protein [Caballeronia sp. LZ062]